MAYATPADVEARLGRTLNDSEAIVVDSRLGDAELILKLQIPTLDDQVAASVTYEALVVMVESDMVIRLVKNPDGYSAETDGNYSYQIDSNVASGRLEVLDEEWNRLGVKATFGILNPYLELPFGESSTLIPLSMETAIAEGWA